MVKVVADINMYMGCDPEFFFKLDGQVIGAEKVIPKKGLQRSHGFKTTSKFIIDGVQAELNPRPDTCRANLANEIVGCFKTLKDELAKKGGKITADFSRTIEISKEKLLELDAQAKRFGCAPSRTIYRNKAGVNINNVDPIEYRTRAAGGHIHIGGCNHAPLDRALKKDYKRTVEMLDLILGNTSVLIDRDEGNIERRKYYGRAGEFRLPEHGLEYRTLSNFWLTSYPLMSLVFGLARLSVQLMSCSSTKDVEDNYKAFTKAVKRKDIKEAINNNDFDLAMENFLKIEPLLKQVIDVSRGGRYPFNANTLPEFHYFIKTVNEKGLNHWFPDDPLHHWTTIGECHVGGFYDFIRDRVSPLIRRETTEVTQAAEVYDYLGLLSMG